MRLTGRWATNITGIRHLASAIAGVCLAVLFALHVAAQKSPARDGRSLPASQQELAGQSLGTVVQLDGTFFTCPSSSSAEGLLRLAQQAMDVHDTEAVRRLTTLAEALGARVETNRTAEPTLCIEVDARSHSPRAANHAAHSRDTVDEVIPPPAKTQPSGCVILGGVTPRIIIQEEEEERLAVEP